MFKRLLELIRGNQVFFKKNFPELARHSPTPMLSGMTYTFIHTPAPACDFLQVAESHEVIGIVRNSGQVVKAIPLDRRFPLTFGRRAGSGRDGGRDLSTLHDFRSLLRTKLAVTRLQTYRLSYIIC